MDLGIEQCFLVVLLFPVSLSQENLIQFGWLVLDAARAPQIK
jgi:hypothetical protein